MKSTDIIRELCGKRGISIARLEKELLLGNGTIASSKSNYMRSDRLKAIADYFGVSMEYLMTGEKDNDVVNRTSVLSDQDRELLDMLRELNQDGQQKALEYIKDLYDTGKYKKDVTDSQSLKEA